MSALELTTDTTPLVGEGAGQKSGPFSIGAGGLMKLFWARISGNFFYSAVIDVRSFVDANTIIRVSEKTPRNSRGGGR